MNKIAHRYRESVAKKDFFLSVSRACALFFASVVASFLADTYASEKASNPVTDIILSNTSAYDVDMIFIYGVFVLILLITAVILSRPQRIPFVLESLGVFILIRSLFVTLTHIGPFPERTPFDSVPAAARLFFFPGDLFFSGHTGIPFLLALVFWHTRTLRYIFLGWSVLFAITALLGHYHYTIDVLSAYFITYTIFHMVVWLFPKDYNTLLS